MCCVCACINACVCMCAHACVNACAPTCVCMYTHPILLLSFLFLLLLVDLFLEKDKIINQPNNL